MLSFFYKKIEYNKERYHWEKRDNWNTRYIIQIELFFVRIIFYD